MKVIVIKEANHGILGIAKDIPSAIDFLIETDWLHWYDAFLVDDGHGDYVWKDLYSIFDSNWKEELKTCSSVEQLNAILGEGDAFWFTEVEVYEG